MAPAQAVSATSGIQSVTGAPTSSAPRPARTPATSPSTDFVTDAKKCGVAASMPGP